MAINKTRLLGAFSIILLGALPGCTYEPVKVWQRGQLANPVMVRDPDVGQAALEQHVYSSKESTSGGYSTGAGGCGCS